MATSTCPKCNNHSFELVENTPKGSKFKLSFIQCASCGTVVGVMDYFNIGDQLRRMAEALKIRL